MGVLNLRRVGILLRFFISSADSDKGEKTLGFVVLDLFEVEGKREEVEGKSFAILSWTELKFACQIKTARYDINNTISIITNPLYLDSII